MPCPSKQFFSGKGMKAYGSGIRCFSVLIFVCNGKNPSGMVYSLMIAASPVMGTYSMAIRLMRICDTFGIGKAA